MSADDSEVIDPTELDPAELKALCWRNGDLSYLVLPHQRDVYDAFWAWQATKHERERRLAWARDGLLYHHLWHWEIARRWGKTVLALLLCIEFCIRRPGSVGLLCTALQSSIGSIILKIIRTVFRPEAPLGYCPEYRTSKEGESHVLYIPAVDSTITLVGLDLHSDKTRGNFQDFAFITEAGFVGEGKLYETYVGAISQQFRGRPWAWAIMESSTSPIPDHEFQTAFKDDCAGRGTHVFKTIDDSDLTDEEVELEAAILGGRDSAIAQRELWCRTVVDEQRAVVPEFDEARDVVDEYERPEYACAVTALDPGTKDKCGVVWFYVDFISARIVVESAWAESNQHTEAIADVIRETEHELWGAKVEVVRPPLESLRVHDLLKPSAEVHPPDKGRGSQHIAGARVLGGGAVWEAPPGALTFWDDQKRTLKPNPWKRFSDVQAQMQLDMRLLHQLNFDHVEKGKDSRETHVNFLRVLCQQDRLRIVRNERTKPLIEQLRSGRWNENRTDFEKSKKLGHLDALMALAYGARSVNWTINPYRPVHVDPYAPDVIAPPDYDRKVLRPRPSRYQRPARSRR